MGTFDILNFKVYERIGSPIKKKATDGSLIESVGLNELDEGDEVQVMNVWGEWVDTTIESEGGGYCAIIGKNLIDIFLIRNMGNGVQESGVIKRQLRKFRLINFFRKEG